MYCIYCSLQILHMSGDFCTVVYITYLYVNIMHINIYIGFFLKKGSSLLDEPIYVVEVLLYCAKTTKKLAGGEVPLPCKPDEKGEMQVN